MNFDIETFEILSQSIINTLKRFPMASFSAFLLTIIVISLIELEFYQRDSQIVVIATKVAFVASLGIILFPALRLLYPSSILSLLGIVILSGYYYILPANIIDSQNHIFLRHTLLIFALFLMLIWAPFVNVKISNKNIWEWTQNIILSLFATILFSIILYAGLSLGLYAIDQLFEIDISSRRYAQLAVLVFGLYGVNFFLSQMPKYILLVQVRTYTKIEIIFTKYILTTLAIGYFLILFAYDIKILINMEFPKGVLAWLTVAFSIVAVATYLFWTPLWNDKNKEYKKYIQIAVLIQSLMLGLAIWIRVDEYGFTESRYFISLFGVWLFLISLYFILIKSASYKWLFITLTLLIISSQFGKYSASEVSKNDQIKRLYEILEDAKPISENLDIPTKYRISNLINYLSYKHGKESLSSLIPNIIHKHNRLLSDINSTNSREYYFLENFSRFATKELGFKFINSWEYKEYMRIGSIRKEFIVYEALKYRNSIKIDGYQWLTYFYYSKHEKRAVTKVKIDDNMSIFYKNNSLYITDNKKTLINVSLNSLLESLERDKNITNSNKMVYLYKNKKVKVKLFINQLTLLDDKNISSINCRVLVGKPSKN